MGSVTILLEWCHPFALESFQILFEKRNLKKSSSHALILLFFIYYSSCMFYFDFFRYFGFINLHAQSNSFSLSISCTILQSEFLSKPGNLQNLNFTFLNSELIAACLICLFFSLEHCVFLFTTNSVLYIGLTGSTK